MNWSVLCTATCFLVWVCDGSPELDGAVGICEMGTYLISIYLSGRYLYILGMYITLVLAQYIPMYLPIQVVGDIT